MVSTLKVLFEKWNQTNAMHDNCFLEHSQKQIKTSKKKKLKIQNICYSAKYFQSQKIGLKNQVEEESG